MSEHRPEPQLSHGPAPLYQEPPPQPTPPPSFNKPTAPPSAPMENPYAPMAPSPAPVVGSAMPAQPVVFVMSEQPSRICQNCKTGFVQHTQRYGIPWTMLILTIIVSLFIPIFLLLFICFCGTYPVCPNCGKFTGHAESNATGVCLC